MITYHDFNLEDLRMSNSLSRVFFAALVLAAKGRAETEQEKLFCSWIGGGNQNVFGSGIVGFDIVRMPWQVTSLEEDKAFLLELARLAQEKCNWTDIDFRPREDWLFEALDKFAELISAFDKSHIIVGDDLGTWSCGRLDTLEKCSKLGTYNHIGGCMACNEGIY